MEIAFPAVFIHFTNVRYLVQQQRIGEGRATMRVRFILNTLNNQDEDKECYPFYVFQKINMAIQDDAPEHNENQHDNHTSPTYNEVTGIVMTDGSDPEPEEDQIYNSLLTEDENALMWSDGQYVSLTDKVQE